MRPSRLHHVRLLSVNLVHDAIEIDLSPVVVYPRGEGVVALDALILAE